MPRQPPGTRYCLPPPSLLSPQALGNENARLSLETLSLETLHRLQGFPAKPSRNTTPRTTVSPRATPFFLKGHIPLSLRTRPPSPD